MNWIALVPMRSGSKGIRNKNTVPIAGKPLYQYTIEAAIEAKASQIFISTNILGLPKRKYSSLVTYLSRSESLSTDETPMSEVVLDFLNNPDYSKLSSRSIIVLLQPTSPLRKASDITKSLELFSNSNSDLLISVTKGDKSVLKSGFIENGNFKPVSSIEYCFQNRQLLPEIFKPNGAIYIFKAGWFQKNQSFETPSIIAYKMDPEKSHDVDTKSDLEKIEKILLKEEKF